MKTTRSLVSGMGLALVLSLVVPAPAATSRDWAQWVSHYYQAPQPELVVPAVFALSQMPKDEGVPLLINVARTHANPAVRKQAMFWLGQSKDPRALKFFEEVLR